MSGSTIESIPEAISVAFNQRVYEKKREGQDIITLSLGEAYFDLPTYSFDGIDIDRGYHYTDSQGLPELRQKLAEYYNSCYNSKIDSSNLLISAGSKIIIFMCIAATVQTGDEVLMFEPAWLSYEHQVTIAGAKPVFVPINAALEEIEKYLTSNTRMLILNNPNNPAGRVYTLQELIYLDSICRKHNIQLLVDEAYSDFVQPTEYFSMASIDTDLKNSIIVNSLSKTMGMSGWRIGFAVASPDLINKLLILNQHLITCAPTILQLFLVKHFNDIRNVTFPQAQSLNKKRKDIEKILINEGISYAKGSSTFYIFLDLTEYYEDTYDLAVELLEKFNISMVPGSAYGKSTRGYLRISIGVENIERISHAINVLKSEYIDDRGRALK